MGKNSGTPGKTPARPVVTDESPTTAKSEVQALKVKPAETKLPLSQRSIDLWLAIWFVIFAFSTTFTDLHNFIASIKGVHVQALEHMELLYPPKILTQLYFDWARTVDPLLYENPIWWQAIEWMNLCILTPAAFIFPFALLAGASWVRIPAVVVSSFTAYSLVLCIGSTLFGPNPSADPSTFTGIYIIYLLQPLVVILRFSFDKPFHRLGKAFNAFLVLCTLANFALFFAYVLKWMALHRMAWFPEAAVPHLTQLKTMLP